MRIVFFLVFLVDGVSGIPISSRLLRPRTPPSVVGVAGAAGASTSMMSTDRVMACSLRAPSSELGVAGATSSLSFAINTLSGVGSRAARAPRVCPHLHPLIPVPSRVFLRVTGCMSPFPSPSSSSSTASTASTTSTAPLASYKFRLARLPAGLTHPVFSPP